MKTKLFLISILIGFIFTSCEKCQDCEIKYEYINNEYNNVAPIYELAAAIQGFNSWDQYWNSTDSIQLLNKEYCDDELKENQDYSQEYDTDSSGINDFRIYYDCK